MPEWFLYLALGSLAVMLVAFTVCFVVGAVAFLRRML